MKKLSIIIVSWQVRSLLQTCLESIRNNRDRLDLEVIVVDNNSNDGTKEMLLQLNDTSVQSILLNANLGFARGNNEGLKYATGEYVLFLNPDTEIIENALQEMVAYLDTHKEVGALGAKLLNPDNSLQRSVNKFPTLFSQLVVLTKLHNFIPRLPAVKNYYQLDFDYTKNQPVDYVMGAALMVRKRVLDTVGVFDPGFKRIYEEVDLCFRIRESGEIIQYIPTAQIIHHKGQSFSKTRIIRKQLDFNQGMLRFFKKHKPKWQYMVLVLFQPISWIAAFLQSILAGVGDPMRKRFKRKDL